VHGNIKATFNIVGQHLDWAGSYMNDIVREGHSIGLHSMNHVYPWYEDPAYETPYEQLAELMERVTGYLPSGKQPQVWRAPGGLFADELPAPFNQILYCSTTIIITH
jgi:peptidoglycan/xylan/chitin deacetylase (PgdA/CDA1 family)